jgi:hypothetical protein
MSTTLILSLFSFMRKLARIGGIGVIWVVYITRWLIFYQTARLNKELNDKTKNNSSFWKQTKL